MNKKDYNKISFKNKAIDKIGNGGGGDPNKEDKFGNRAGGELHHVVSKFTYDNTTKTRKGKSKSKSKSKSQVAVTDLHRGEVVHVTSKSKKVRTDKGKGKFKHGYTKGKFKQVGYVLPGGDDARGDKTVMTNRGRGNKYRHKTLTKRKTAKLREKFGMGKTIKP